MQKKSVLFLILSLLLFSSIQFQSSTQGAVAQDNLPLNNVRMVGLSLQLLQNGTSYYTAVNNSANAKLTNAQNNTIAKFVASFVNENITTPFILQAFYVYLFNSSTQSTYANKLSYYFISPSTKPGATIVNPNSTYTVSFEGGLPFTLTDSVFQIQYQIQYSTLANQSSLYSLNSPFNFSLNSILPPYSPPTFVIYAWWVINAAIVVQLVIGWYGNRKLKKIQEAKNSK